MSNKEKTEVYRSVEILTDFIPEWGKGVTTIPAFFEASSKKYGERNLYKFRNVVKHHIERNLSTNKDFITYEMGDVHSLSYSQTFEIVKALASGIHRFCPELKPRDRIGIYLNTCLQWPLSLLASYRLSLCVTTVYATLGWDSLLGSLNEAEISTMVCAADNVKNIDKYLGAGKCPKLKKLICVGALNDKSEYFETTTVYDLIVDGFANPLTEEIEPAKAEDLALIMYTSGTTGSPKGVMIQHRNVISQISGILNGVQMDCNDVHLSYLPFAHIYEMVVHMAMLSVGGEIVFGTPRTLFAKPGGAMKLGDIEICKPTVFVGVPKVWETLRKGIAAKVSMGTPMEQFMFNMVLTAKMKMLMVEKKNEKILFQPFNIPLEDTVFAKVRGMLGGKIRRIVSGGAPLVPETQAFIQATIGPNARIIQAYGLTEVCGASHLEPLETFSTNNVGVPITGCEVKVIDVPEMGYFAKNKMGEICVRGPIVSLGYFKREELTKEIYGEDGWFRTGDVGKVLEDGTFQIIDRVKNLVKLSGGEYVAIKSVECKYSYSNLIAPNGICCFADSHEDHIVAVILPDPNLAKIFGMKNKIGGDLNTIVKSPVFIDALGKDLLEIAKKENFNKWEILTKDRFVVKNDIWLPENGLLTAASKLKRKALFEKYKGDVADLYKGKKKKEETEGEMVVVKKDNVENSVPTFFQTIKPNFV